MYFKKINYFNSNKRKIVHLENVIFIHFNVCPLTIFARMRFFLQAFAIESF